MPESLKDKTIKGVVWSSIDNVSQLGVSFLVGIILARLLSPDDYGLLGIVGIFTMICSTLINAGFSSALIRKKNVTYDDYNTVFIVNLAISVMLYSGIFLSAPLIAYFFNRVELVNLTRVSSFSMVIGALAMVQQTRLCKRIDFKSQTKITLSSSISSGALGITMALLGFGVWALVVQQLSRSILSTVQLCYANKWIPSLRFSSSSFHNLFGFGWKMMLSELIDAIWNELYQVVVGKFYSPATLGQYTRAKHLSQLFSSNITSVIQKVTYPVLSNIQDDQQRMVSAYRRIIKVTMFVTVISMFSLAAVSEPLIYCLIGPKWHEAATYLPLICLSGSLYPLHSINLNMLKVQGRSDLFLFLEIIKKFIGIAPLAICYFYGVMSMLYINLITGVICYFLNSHYSGVLLGYTSWMQLRDIAPSYGIAILIALSVYFLKYLPMSYWLILPIQAFLGIFIFLVVCYHAKVEEFYEIEAILKSQKEKIKSIIGVCHA